MYANLSSPEFMNCLFEGNTAYSEGAVFYTIYHSYPVLRNCTVVNNVSLSDGRCIQTSANPNLVLENCILWNNTPYEVTRRATVRHSLLPGGFPGVGNLDADPLFVSGPLGDYYLSHTAAGEPEDSPCLDAGNDLAENICFDFRYGEICLDQFFTNPAGTPDSDVVDIGFHYGYPQNCANTGDVNADELITAGGTQQIFYASLGEGACVDPI